MLSFNHYYLLGWVEPDMKVLDYGCGAGELVLEGRKKGYDIYGADVFYEGGNTKKDVEKANALNDTIYEIIDGKLSFEDNSFDMVLCNQVFEHVHDLNQVLIEISRVMKKGGVLVCLFPSSGVIREGHIGIPFAHWFRKKSKIRFVYVLLFRFIGLGYHKGKKTNMQWTKDALKWIDKYVIYRSKKEITNTFSKHFEIKFIEDEYVSDRIGSSNKLKFLTKLFKMRGISPITKLTFRLLGGLAIIAKKNDPKRYS